VHVYGTPTPFHPLVMPLSTQTDTPTHTHTKNSGYFCWCIDASVVQRGKPVAVVVVTRGRKTTSHLRLPVLTSGSCLESAQSTSRTRRWRSTRASTSASPETSLERPSASAQRLRKPVCLRLLPSCRLLCSFAMLFGYCQNNVL